MKYKLNPEAEAIFRELIEGVDDYLKIANDPYTSLVIEFLYDMDDVTEVWSFAHYFEMNGDLVASPDVEWVVSPKGVTPIQFQNELMFDRQENGSRGLKEFGETWMQNLKDQGFVEAKNGEA